jgi:hypothetical protein
MHAPPIEDADLRVWPRRRMLFTSTAALLPAGLHQKADARRLRVRAGQHGHLYSDGVAQRPRKHASEHNQDAPYGRSRPESWFALWSCPCASVSTAFARCAAEALAALQACVTAGGRSVLLHRDYAASDLGNVRGLSLTAMSRRQPNRHGPSRTGIDGDKRFRTAASIPRILQLQSLRASCQPGQPGLDSTGACVLVGDKGLQYHLRSSCHCRKRHRRGRLYQLLGRNEKEGQLPRSPS